MISGVYALKCLRTGQYYVGTGVDWQKRVASHLRKLSRSVHGNYKLQAAWNEYGPTAFEFRLLEECPFERLLECEKRWAEELQSATEGFNLHTLGSNGMLRHGLSNSRTHKSWESMFQRCTNKNAPDYPKYGGAGIRVCRRWRKFENFLSDMGERPEGTSLDRYPNKHGNYFPNNCRWATPTEQQRNLKSNQYLTYNGETKFLVDWAREKSIPVDLLRKRVNADMEGDELFAPSYSRYAGDGKLAKRRRLETRDIKRITFRGKTLSLTEWAKELGITRSTLSQRINKYKMPIEKALVGAPLKRGKEGPRAGNRLLTAFGKTQSLTAWAREYNLPVSTLKNRIYRAKLPPEKALTARIYAQQRGRGT